MYELTEEQKLLQDTLRRLAREHVAPRAAEIDARAEYPQDMFELLRDQGLFALPFPEEYGGTGSVLTACLAIEELSRICYNTAYLLVVQWVPFAAVHAAGSEEQKARLLPALAAGEIRMALAVTESGAGSDVGGLKTRASACDGGYAISGSKIFCTNAAVADFVITAARTSPGAGSRGISLFLVPTDAPGFACVRNESKLGGRGVPSSELRYDDVRVSEADRLGDENDGFKRVMAAFNHSRPIIGARGVGLAQGAMDLAANYARERQAFGQPIGGFQGLRWIIADMAIQIEAARHLVYRAAAVIDREGTGKGSAAIAAMAKCFATDVAMKVAVDAVQVYGAAGISKDLPIERFMRDAKLLQIVEGTNQIQRNIVADTVLGRF